MIDCGVESLEQALERNMHATRRDFSFSLSANMTAMVGAALLTALGANPAAAAAPASLATSHAGFCTEVQRMLVDTSLPMSNTLQRSKDDFTESKAAVTPLTTQQFLVSTADGLPEELSCKTKTADHLRAVHGAGAARDPALPPRSCRDVQRAVVLQVWESLNADEQAGAAQAPQRIMLVADTLSYTGSGWIGSPAEVWLGSDGQLRLRASALYANWEDWRWKIMPESFRGNHYCHLVAPERVRRLMLGEERLSPR
jgi:hypothetical protein